MTKLEKYFAFVVWVLSSLSCSSPVSFSTLSVQNAEAQVDAPQQQEDSSPPPATSVQDHAPQTGTIQENTIADQPIEVAGAFLTASVDCVHLGSGQYGCEIRMKEVTEVPGFKQVLGYLGDEQGARVNLPISASEINPWHFMVSYSLSEASSLIPFDIEITDLNDVVNKIPKEKVRVFHEPPNPVPAPAPTPAPPPAPTPAPPPAPTPPPAEFNLLFANSGLCLTAPSLPDGQAFSVTYALKEQTCSPAAKLVEIKNPNGTVTYKRGANDCLQAFPDPDSGSILFGIARCTRQGMQATEFQTSIVNRNGRSGTSLNLPSYPKGRSGWTCLGLMTSPYDRHAFMWNCQSNVPLNFTK